MQLHGALEADPSVGIVISLPLLIAEIQDTPLSVLLSTEQLLNILEGSRYDHIALSFVTKDREGSSSSG